ncbi:hypothetical protein A33M_0623 [Rhodovulum sp. PH10]|uniref:GNAT family N-acetyltransferase n=1 Tax=Rhodovulum sp. PH10 TaxID=1187851 RepID=UPI00027C2736|nr:GNAT family N-acetyltransferase [Rhodovulum sp. PH10]EJW13131.1 hypothetical protein A33M_0623 [Rhodovulum sp. PH10]
MTDDFGAFRVEREPLAALADAREAWQALAERAAEPNVFLSPAVALAALPAFGRGVEAVAVRAADGRLAGMFPLRRRVARNGLPRKTWVGWSHVFAPLGTPLVDRAAPEPVVAAFLAAVAAAGAVYLVPQLPDGPVADAFAAVLARTGGCEAQFGRHARALLRPAEGPPDNRRRREHARQRRRLSEQGTLVFEAAETPAGIAAALADFLALEARGWKGSAGTAAAQTPAQRSFLTEAVTALAEARRARIVRLALDGRSVAAGIVLVQEPAAWFWKIAYDEDFSKFSPGVQLTLALSDALVRERRFAFVDSCATENHPMIDRLWPGRRLLADRLIAPAPAGPAFSLACRLEAGRRAAIARAKRLRDALRR